MSVFLSSWIFGTYILICGVIIVKSDDITIDVNSKRNFQIRKIDEANSTEVIFDENISNVAAWAAVICSILGCIGNFLTILVLLWKSTLRKHSTTPFLLSLACSDFCFSAFNLPIVAARYFSRSWPFSTCTFYPVLFYANICISAFSMAFVALNRYVGIFYNHKMTNIFSLKKSYFMIFVLWVFAFGIMLLPMTKTWGQFGLKNQTFSCTMIEDDLGENPKTTFLIIGSGLPLVIISFCYVCIYCKVRRSNLDLQDIMDKDVIDSKLSRQMAKREAAITKTTLIVWTGYFVCFIPTTLTKYIRPMPPNRNYAELHIAGYVIFWCSAFINPIIYTVCNQNYRKALLEMISTMLLCNDETTRINSSRVDRSKSLSKSEKYVVYTSVKKNDIL